jgi:poly-beta-1,6-N-acetyl-D-glucosamine synthase
MELLLNFFSSHYFWFAVAIFIICVYSYNILSFRLAWIKNIKNTPLIASKSFEGFFISVIVPFKNEELSLPNFIAGIRAQSLVNTQFEVVFVDDNSTDASRLLIPTNVENFKLLLNDGVGKKDALCTGITAARANLIVTIDADCFAPKGWLEGIRDSYLQNKANMFIGGVKMIAKDGFISDFATLDYYALQMSGAGSAMLDKPVFCSGANLVFDKESWMQASSLLDGVHLKSGDDVFLLHAFKKLRKSISFLNNPETIVETDGETTLKKFLYQRMRWGGKSSAYKDLETIKLAMLVFITNLFLFVLMFLSFFLEYAFVLFMILFLLKLATDFLLLKAGLSFFKMRITFAKYVVFSLLYPIYIAVAALGGFFIPEKWK